MGARAWFGWWPWPRGGGGGGAAAQTFPAATRRRGRAGDLPSHRVDPRLLTSTLEILRARSKLLVRADSHAGGMVRDLADQLVGATGLLPAVEEPVWRSWVADREQCDAEGRLPLVGLQCLAARSQIVTGEAFVLARLRRSDSRFPLPLSFLVLDGDALTSSPAARIPPRHRVEFGIEYSATGRRAAYHFRVPSPRRGAGEERSIRVPAAEVFHLFEAAECGMERGWPWTASIILDMDDLGAYKSAVLKKSRLHAEIAAISSRLDDVDASVAPSEDDDEALTPGYELRLAPGSDFKAFNPAATSDVKDFISSMLAGAAVGVGATAEDVRGDYAGLNFSAARLSALKQERRAKARRERGLAPLSRWMYRWCRRAAKVRGWSWPEVESVEFLHPPMDVVEPDRESRAALGNVRAGFSSLFDELRRRGHSPREWLKQVAQEQAEIEALGLVFDSDPRLRTAQGQAQDAPVEEERRDGEGA